MSIKDGGPFHPCEVMWRADGSVDGVQTQNHAGIHTGASLRDHFAGLAMAALITAHRDTLSPSTISESAYSCANAMIRSREAGQ